MLKALIVLLFMLPLGVAQSGEFRTANPLKAFLGREYMPGDDYFIEGTEDTYLFRCVLTREKDGFEGLALSEISIWGNRTGPWEIFRKEKDGSFSYAETRPLTDTSCLESCRSEEYLATGRCRWHSGWPER